MHSDALGEVARGLEIVELACGITTQLKGELSTQVSNRVDVSSIRQPLGVVAGITPFNFPAMVPMWMFPLAIACGNTFVLKPSEKDPSAANLLAELAAEAGLPDGVLNVVHGDKVAVDALLAHPDVAAVSFVGSTPIARYIHTTASANGKRVQALGGAKNHMLVLPDADLDAAADAAVSAAYGSAGERCMAISAVVAVGSIADELVDKIRERAEKIKIGPGNDPASEMGPLITKAHRDKVASYVTGAAAQGADVVLDGTGYTVEGFEDGHWIGLSLLDRVSTDSDAYRDEIFGPVLCVLRAETYEEGVALINASPFGNGTADLHPRRRRGPPLPAGDRGRHGRRERTDPGAGGLPLLRRLEGLALRRPPHLRQRRRALLHPRQGRHDPLAGPGRGPHRRGPGLPAQPLTAPRNQLTAPGPYGLLIRTGRLQYASSNSRTRTRSSRAARRAPLPFNSPPSTIPQHNHSLQPYMLS